MSEARDYTSGPSFFDLYERGEVGEDDIDGYISHWHRDAGGDARELHEYLGLTWPEYAQWMVDYRALDRILEARRLARSTEAAE